jgi:hypothetical protein
MRHLAPLVVVVLAICSSSTAFAVDHFMRIDEVLVSKDNATAIQFIELDDPSQESFPNNPYRLELYSAQGTLLPSGTVQFNITPGTQRLYIATAAADTAFGKTRDATLPVTLPADGQACFVSSLNTKIMCLAWGCIQSQIVGNVMLRAPSPPNDQSAQRQANGSYQLAAPTPDATNDPGTMAANCPTDPDAAPVLDGPLTDGPLNADAGLTPDGGGGNNNNDDGGGCCHVEGSRGALGTFLLAFSVLIVLRRTRRVQVS